MRCAVPFLRPILITIAAFSPAGLSACERGSDAAPETAANPAAPETQTSTVPPSQPKEFEAKCVEIARTYSAWQRVSDNALRGILLCVPSPTLLLEREQPTRSTSTHESTHGKKLYWLYVSDADAYPFGSSMRNRPPGAHHVLAPVGQTLVKQSWSVKPVTQAWAEEPIHLVRCIEENGQYFAADVQQELFIMTKLDPATPGTDTGWVYAVVKPDGSEVIRSGMLSDCMGCHEDAANDRMLGLGKKKDP